MILEIVFKSKSICLPEENGIDMIQESQTTSFYLHNLDAKILIGNRLLEYCSAGSNKNKTIYSIVFDEKSS